MRAGVQFTHESNSSDIVALGLNKEVIILPGHDLYKGETLVMYLYATSEVETQNNSEFRIKVGVKPS